MNILLIDDDRLSLTMLNEALRMSGYSCMGFNRPDEGLNEFMRNEYDVVISDYQMPVLNGVQLLKKMIDVKPDSVVLLSSGFIDDKIKAEALSSGAYGFLQKPLDVFEVISKLSTIEKDINNKVTI